MSESNEKGGFKSPPTAVAKTVVEYEQTAPTIPPQLIELAHKYPRDLKKFKQRVEDAVAQLGAGAIYQWGAAGEQIIGGSIEMAMALASAYGNCIVDSPIIAEDDDAITFGAYFIDLETNTCIRRMNRARKDRVIHGKFDESRKTTMRFEIGQSIAQRNVVLKMFGGYVKNLVELARSSELENINAMGLGPAKREVLRILKKYGVTVARVCARMNRASEDDLTAVDLIDLKSAITILKDEQATALDLFPDVAPKKEFEKTEPPRVNTDPATDTATDLFEATK